MNKGFLVHSHLDAGEQWCAHTERSQVGDVPAFGLYFLLHIPDDESFGGASPDEEPAQHSPNLVLGFTGDTDTRLVNVLLDSDHARQLAKLLKKAAKKVDQ